MERTRWMIYRGGNRVVSNDIRPRFGNIFVRDANATEVHGKKLRCPCPLSGARPGGDDYRVWHGAQSATFYHAATVTTERRLCKTFPRVSSHVPRHSHSAPVDPVPVPVDRFFTPSGRGEATRPALLIIPDKRRNNCVETFNRCVACRQAIANSSIIALSFSIIPSLSNGINSVCY